MMPAMNRIARVVVDLALNRQFDYLIPESLAGQVRVGSRVRVPFGHIVRQGYVVALAVESAFKNLKPIASIVGKGELLTPNLIALAEYNAGRNNVGRWMEDATKANRPVVERIQFPETRRYVTLVLARAEKYRQRGKL